jgi:hypothetical protein
MDWVSVALEEYKTLRTESLQAIEQMQRTLQIGVAAIGLITGFGIDSQTETAVQAGIAAATPALALTVLVLWLDQLRRSVFAGAHLALLEDRVARRFEGEEPPLSWETNIQKQDAVVSGYRYHRHWAVLVALFAAAAPMVVTGLIRLGRDGEDLAFGLTAVAALLLLGVAIAYQAHIHKLVSNKHTETCEALGVEPDGPRSPGASATAATR